MPSPEPHVSCIGLGKEPRHVGVDERKRQKIKIKVISYSPPREISLHIYASRLVKCVRMKSEKLPLITICQ